MHILNTLEFYQTPAPFLSNLIQQTHRHFPKSGIFPGITTLSLENNNNSNDSVAL